MKSLKSEVSLYLTLSFILMAKVECLSNSNYSNYLYNKEIKKIDLKVFLNTQRFVYL